MIIAMGTQFHVYLPWGKRPFSIVSQSIVGAFNLEKTLVGAFSVIVQPVVEKMDRFATLDKTIGYFVTMGLGKL